MGRCGSLAGALAIVAVACSGGGAGMPGAKGGAGGAGSGGATGSAGDAGSGGAMAGAGGGGAAGSAGGGVAPGTCGVSRRIPLPELPRNFQLALSAVNQPDHVVRRVAGGFAVGPWVETRIEAGGFASGRLHWLRIDPDGDGRTMYSTAWGSPTSFLEVFNMLTPSRLVLVRPGGFYELWTGVLDDGGTSPTSVAKLVDDEATKFLGLRGNGSLDGQRGLFMTSVIGGHPPWLTTFAADGTPVGGVLQMTADGVCEAVLPTEHGATFSIVEGSNFHVIEVSAAGSPVLDVSIPFPMAAREPTGCPSLVLTDAGFAHLALEVTGPGTAGWNLHRIARDGTTTVEPWETLQGCTLRALAVQGETALAACSFTEGNAVVRRTRGRDERFPLERTGAQIHSEPGTMFLDVDNHLLPAGTTDALREIFEIRCAD